MKWVRSQNKVHALVAKNKMHSAQRNNCECQKKKNKKIV